LKHCVAQLGVFRVSSEYQQLDLVPESSKGFGNAMGVPPKNSTDYQVTWNRLQEARPESIEWRLTMDVPDIEKGFVVGNQILKYINNGICSTGSVERCVTQEIDKPQVGIRQQRLDLGRRSLTVARLYVERRVAELEGSSEIHG